MHGVEPVGRAQEVIGCLGAATDARELGDPVGFDIELPAGLDNGGGDRVMTATGTQRGDPAFIVAPREPDLIALERRVMQDWLGDKRHTTSFWRSAAGALAGEMFRCSRIKSVMNRSVIGVPS